MKFKQILTILVFANIFLAVGFSQDFNINVLKPITKNQSSESPSIEFVVATTLTNSALLELQKSGESSWSQWDLDCTSTRVNGNCKDWALSKDFDPGFYEYKISSTYGNAAPSSPLFSFTIIDPTTQSQTTPPTSPPAGGAGAGGTDNTDDSIDEAANNETLTNDASSPPEDSNPEKEDSDEMTIPEIIPYQDLPDENLQGEILEDENLEDENIEEGPKVEIAPSEEEPKKGICGPTVLLLLASIPLQLLRTKK